MTAIHRTLSSIAILGMLAWGSGHALAQASADPSALHGTAAAAVGADGSQELSEGEVTRWDARSGKITLRHGELKNLGMPPHDHGFHAARSCSGRSHQSRRQTALPRRAGEWRLHRDPGRTRTLTP